MQRGGYSTIRYKTLSTEHKQPPLQKESGGCTIPIQRAGTCIDPRTFLTVKSLQLAHNLRLIMIDHNLMLR